MVAACVVGGARDGALGRCTPARTALCRMGPWPWAMTSPFPLLTQKQIPDLDPQFQAFSCRVCKYTAEVRRKECAGHPHAVERVEAVKRWWECEACRYRFSTVGVKYPTSRCTK